MTTDNVPNKWTAKNITSQQGKTAIVTGANSGIGYYTALELARHGANVVLACRNEQRGIAAVQTIRDEIRSTPQAGKVEFLQLDVGSLASVKAFVAEFTRTHDSLDLLINNAGIFAVPFALSPDGFESQFATNHLGHFSLTAQLLPLLKQSPQARVVNISSELHTGAKMDLHSIVAKETKYDPMQEYKNSKLYNLLFTHELNRRFKQHGIKNVIAVTAHPGVSTTNLTANTAASRVVLFLVKVATWLSLTQDSEGGALPTLYAATAPNVRADDFYGPDGFGHMSGYPSKQEPQNVSKSPEHAKALWIESERLAKVQFDF